VKEKTLQKRMTGTRERACNRSILYGSSFGTVFKKEKGSRASPGHFNAICKYHFSLSK
jgi:hypothetical protein